MDKSEVIERMCALASKVGTVRFNNTKAHDCFCGLGAMGFDYQFEEEILDFIEDAVDKALAQD